MSKAPPWSDKEFDLMLKNPYLTDHEISDRLKDKTYEEVKAIRDGLHSHHSGDGDADLTKKMIGLLKKVEKARCSRCGDPFNPS